MGAKAFERRLRECLETLAAGKSRIRELWTLGNELPRERQLATLADLYREASPAQQQQIHDSVSDQLIMDLFLYVRHFAILMNGPEDDAWVRRGLALAAIEGGRADYRDLIVSLVLLRHGAERVGIDAKPMFDEALAVAPEAVRAIFENARDHSDVNVRITVREFGPTQWRQP